MKDFTNKDCCLNCQGFCFWDGDYCCSLQMKIHQYGLGNGFHYMTRDIDNTMKGPDTDRPCEDYVRCLYSDDIIEEYKKFKEWDRLCDQLEKHVK